MKKQVVIELKGIQLAKKFARDYYGFKRILASDFTEHPMDKNILSLPVAYGHRLYVTKKTGTVYWGGLSILVYQIQRAEELGYKLYKSLLFNLVFYELQWTPKKEGVKKNDF